MYKNSCAIGESCRTRVWGCFLDFMSLDLQLFWFHMLLICAFRVYRLGWGGQGRCRLLFSWLMVFCMILLVVTTSGLHVRFFGWTLCWGFPKKSALYKTSCIHLFIGVLCTWTWKYWKVVFFLFFLTWKGFGLKKNQPKLLDIVVGMSGAAKVFAELGGLAEEWENVKMLRTRVQNLGCLVAEAPLEGEKEVYLDKIVSRTITNGRYNSDVLLPVFEKMSGHHDKVPELPALCSELKKFYKTHHKVPTKTEMQDQAWSIRYLFGTVKHLLYRPTPPRVSWQCML